VKSPSSPRTHCVNCCAKISFKNHPPIFMRAESFGGILHHILALKSAQASLRK
jgi:hypothetical protein